MRARVPNHHPRTTFHTVSGETVRKVPEVPEMEPHETSQRHHSARSLPGMMARPTLGGLLEPLFGQFQKRNSRKFATRKQTQATPKTALFGDAPALVTHHTCPIS